MADELQAAIDRAEQKLRELENAQPAAKQSAKLLTLVPRMAEQYRRQIALGLYGNPRAALKARVGHRSDAQAERGGVRSLSSPRSWRSPTVTRWLPLQGLLGRIRGERVKSTRIPQKSSP